VSACGARGATFGGRHGFAVGFAPRVTVQRYRTLLERRSTEPCVHNASAIFDAANNVPSAGCRFQILST
jgi:hypothetical protein